jgi:uncharacterized membrane protein YdbT with pleckstrin-like domain
MTDKIVYQGNPAMFRNSPFGFIISVLLIFAFGVGLVILLCWFIKAKSIKFTITDEDVAVERGILSKRKTDIAIKNIRTTKVSQSFGQRLMGVGDIQIFTAGDKPEEILTGLRDPNKIRTLIKP